MRGVSRKANLTKDTILKIATASTVIIVAGSSPYFYHRVVRQFFKEKMKKAVRARARKLAELEKRKLISFKELGSDKVRIELTHQGKKLVRLYDLGDMKLKIPKRWNKKWHIIIYDIPISQRKASQALQGKFKDLGLYRLQKSVWVSPYECLAEIEFLCTVFKISMDRCVHYITTQKIPKEKDIRRFFRF